MDNTVSKESWEELTAILYEIRRLCEMMDKDTLHQAKTALIATSVILDELLGEQIEKEALEW